MTRKEDFELAVRVVNEHFIEWRGMFEYPIELCSFAYYEGCGEKQCCSEILERQTPIILVGELVRRADFEIIKPGRNWVINHRKIGDVSSKDIGEGTWYFDDDKCSCSVKGISFGEICANSFGRLYDQGH